MVNRLLEKTGRLGLKLLGPLLLIALVSLMGALISVYLSARNQRAYSEQIQQVIALQAARGIDDFIGNIQLALRDGANHLAEEGDHHDGYRAVLKSIRQLSPVIHELTFIDLSGQEVEKIVGFKPVDHHDLRNINAEPKFTQALTGQPYIGQIYISEFGFPFVSMSMPVFDKFGQIQGVLSAEVDVSQMWNDITQIANQHQRCLNDPEQDCPLTVYVVDSNGNLIAINSNTARTQGLPNLLKLANTPSEVTDVPIIGVQAFLNGNYSPLTYTGIKDETGQQTTVIGSRESVPSAGWGVIVERPLNVANRQINQYILASTLIILLILLISVLTAIYIARQVINPLNVMQQGVAVLAQGQFEHHINIHTGDELELLADEFNAMSASLLQSQQSLAQAAEEKTLLYQQAQRQVDELDVINQINHTVMASLDVETTIDAVLRNLHTLIEYRSAEINLWLPETERLKAYAVGDTSYTSAADYYYNLDEGFTGWLAQNRKPLLIGDVQKNTQGHPKLPLTEFPYRAYIGLPLIVGSDFLGTLELAHPERNYYTQDDLTSLQTIGGQAALAIRHAQLFQESRERAQAQQQLAEIAAIASATLELDQLLERIMKQTVAAVGGEKGFLLLLDEDQSALIPHPASVVGFDEGAVTTLKLSLSLPQIEQTVLFSRQPFFSNNTPADLNVPSFYHPFLDAFDIQSSLIVPLIAADKNIGEIHIHNKAASFTPRDVTFLSSVASQFAVAIQNATLFKSTQDNLHQLSILHESVADLSSTLSVDEVLANLAQRMVSILPVDECTISRFNPTTHLLEVVVVNESNPQTKAGASRAYNVLDYPQTADVLQNHQPVVVRKNDPAADPAEKKFLQAWGFNLLLMLPLVARNEAIGLIELYTIQDIAYKSEEIALAQTLASEAAVALQNAQLYHETDEKLKQRIKELDGLQKVSQELNSTLILETINQLVIREAVRATGADFGNVSLYDESQNKLITHVHEGWPEEAIKNTPKAIDTVGIIGRVFKSSIPEIVSDLSKDPDYIPFSIKTGSKMVVPIKYAGSVTDVGRKTDDLGFDEAQLGIVEGVINLEAIQPGAFTTDQLQYVQALADQAAIAIRNARAFEDQIRERRSAALRANQLARLSEIAQAFRANQPLEYILEEISFAIQETANFNVVLLSVARHGLLYPLTGAGIPLAEMNRYRQLPKPIATVEELFQPEFKLGESYFIPQERKAVWENKMEILVIDNLNPNPEAENAWQSNDLLLTPLRNAEGNLIGHLSVDAPADGLRPTRQSVTVLELFAIQAATAIENANLFEELRQQTTQLKLAGQISARISAILNPAELMGEVVNLIAQAFNYYYVQIIQVDESHPQFLQARNGAGTANVDPQIHRAGQRLEINEQSIVGWVAKNQQPLLANNVALEPRYQAVSYLPDTRSEMAVPLKIGTDMFGVLDIQHNQLNAFTKDDLENMRALTDQLSVAIQNARLFDEALQRERLSSALGNTGLALNATLDPDKIYEVICHEAVAAFDVDGAYLWMVEGDQARGIAAAGNNKDSFIGKTIALTETQVLGVRIIKEQRAEFINGVDFDDDNISQSLVKEMNVQSVMGAPLIAGDKTIGSLVLIDSHNPNRFDLQDRISVMLLANQAAIAIENGRLIQRLNKFTEELEATVSSRTEELRLERDRVDTLYNIARELSSSLDLDRVLNEALSLINWSVNVSKGSILMVDDVTGNLVYRAAIGRKPPLPKGGKPTRYRIGIGLAGAILDTRKPVIISDLQENEDWLPDDKPLVHRSVLAVPLITGYEIVGVMMLFHTDKGYFTEDHLRLVTAAAPIIATAINNAGLYNLISDQVERLGILLGTVKAEARKNEAIVQGIADGVLVLDSDNNIQLINPAACAILNLESETLQDQRLDAILSQEPATIDEKLALELYKTINAHQSHLEDEENEPYRIEVESKVILVSMTSVALSTNAPLSKLVVIRDITREAEADRIKNEFVSTVSHELRTPMTSIKGYTDLLVSDKVGPLTDMQRQFIQVIKNNADRLTGLVNDILEISRIDTGRANLVLEHIELPPLIDNLVSSFNTQIAHKNLALTVNMPPQVPLVFADANRVTQVLFNLFGNAVKYTRPGDSITLTIKPQPKFVQIDVADSGLGLSKEDVEHVFDRFFRAERDASSLVDGTGLGLPIAKMFVEMMGGHIWVESELGLGSVFSFTLPLEDHRIEEDRVVDSFANRRRILVVDDNKDVLDVLKRQLEVEGYSVITSLKGRNVLDLAKKYQPSLITLDIMLGDIDGFEVLEQLKDDPETKDIPVVIASVLNDVGKQGLALGAADYITKPFDKEDVLSAVQSLIKTLDDGKGNMSFKNILVADDDKDIVNWLRHALTDDGFKVRGAFNGQEALLLAREDKPDLILLDMKMPGMDGFQVIEKLKEDALTANIPVIVITGSSIDRKSDKIKMLGLGARHMLTKPFSLDQLVSEIKQLEEPANNGTKSLSTDTQPTEK